MSTENDSSVRAGSRSHGRDGLAREVSRGLVVLGLSGTSVGGVVGMVALATHALGR